MTASQKTHKQAYNSLTLVDFKLPVSSNSMSYSTTQSGFSNGGPYETRAEWLLMSVTSRLVGGLVAVEVN